MKKKAYDMLKLKRRIFEMRIAKKKNPIWKLTEAQVEYLENIGYPVTGYLYCIKTRTFPRVKELNELLKEIHYSKQKRNKNMIFKKLSEKQRKLLDEHEVSYRIYKYEIHLNRYDKL